MNAKPSRILGSFLGSLSSLGSLGSLSSLGSLGSLSSLGSLLSVLVSPTRVLRALVLRALVLRALVLPTLVLPVLILPVLVLPVPRLPAEESASERDEWHRILLDGTPAGYTRILTLRREGGGRLVRNLQKLRLRRGDTPLLAEVSIEEEEDSDGRFLAFRFVQKLSQDTMETEGRVKGEVLEIEDRVGNDKPRKSSIPADPKAIGLEKVEAVLKEGLRAPGDSVEAVLFFPEARRYGKQKAVYRANEPRPSGGTLRRITVTYEVLPGIALELWLDEAYRLERSSMDFLGMKLVTERSSAERVLADQVGSPPEIFFAASVPARGPSPAGARESVFRLIAKRGPFPVADDAPLFRSTGQSLAGREGDRARLVRVVRDAAPSGIRLPYRTPADLVPATRGSAYLQSDDPEMIALASRIVGNETDAWKATQALTRWVHENIRVKDLNTAFATAKEVLRRREGDCTEHGVLLAALLRAAGLPSRVVAGLVYQQGSFLGHMWTEVYLDRWVPLDATRREESVSADRIALAASNLEASGVAEFFLDILPLLGALEIEVVETRPRGPDSP